MDLAGPRLPTGSIEPGPEVLKIKPHRDASGRVKKPAVIAIAPGTRLSALSGCIDAMLHIDGDLPPRLATGDAIELDDARGRLRRLVVRARDGDLVVAEPDRTAYVGDRHTPSV
jgi:pyruvate kinase